MLALVDLVARELLLFAACGFLLFAVDDLIVDILWIWHVVSNRSDAHPKSPCRPAHFAIFVPAWQEAPVIHDMVSRCTRAWAGHAAHIFVGTYPNDPATRDAIAPLLSSTVRMVVLNHDGPTTKADCLNGLWLAMLATEQNEGIQFDGIVLHDAEDRVHANELSLFGRYILQYDLIQIPVIPDALRHSRWIAGHYLDEFAEAHQKELLVRQRVGASLPSAGTGCAISTRALSALALERDGAPFDPESLTEDYELGLNIAQRGFKSIFVREMSPEDDRPVAVHSCFPPTLASAVRQKARWIIGIALAGWDRTGWKGGLVEHWMRWRDRRTVISALLVLSAYLGLSASLPSLWLGNASPISGALSYILSANAIFLVWRLAMRVGFTSSQYGWDEGWRAAPRSLVSNLISVLASTRAVFGYCRLLLYGVVVWDKTDHQSSDHGPPE